MKKTKFKKYNHIIIYILLVVVGIIIGISSYAVAKSLSSNNNTNNTEEDQPIIKESPYTLDELYEIVENPQKFYEVNKSVMTDYNLTIYNFYDYFSKTTPVKVASKVKVDKTGKVIEVLETEYLSYEEFKERMSSAYTIEEDIKKSTDEWNKKNNENNDYRADLAYKKWVELLVYDQATQIKA